MTVPQPVLIPAPHQFHAEAQRRVKAFQDAGSPLEAKGFGFAVVERMEVVVSDLDDGQDRRILIPDGYRLRNSWVAWVCLSSSSPDLSVSDVLSCVVSPGFGGSVMEVGAWKSTGVVEILGASGGGLLRHNMAAHMSPQREALSKVVMGRLGLDGALSPMPGMAYVEYDLITEHAGLFRTDATQEYSMVATVVASSLPEWSPGARCIPHQGHIVGKVHPYREVFAAPCEYIMVGVTE